MAMHARNSREHEALFTVALKCWVGYLYPPIRKQQPGGQALSKESSKDMESKGVTSKEEKGKDCLPASAIHFGIHTACEPRSLAAEIKLVPRSNPKHELPTGGRSVILVALAEDRTELSTHAQTPSD